MNLLSAPFHFVVTFVVAIAGLGGLWVAVNRPKFAPEKKLARRGFGAGWMLLALGELAHGAQIADVELDTGALGLRAGAYALIALSLLSARRTSEPSAAAAAASGVALPSSLALFASWMAYRSSLSYARRLAVALALLGVSEIFFASIKSLSEARPGPAWFAVHALRLAGGVALLIWLWRAIKTSIQARFVAVFVSLLMVVVVTISGSITQVFASNLEEDALARSVREAETQNQIIDGQIREAISGARQVAGSDSIRRAVPTRDPRLRATAEGLQSAGNPFDSFDFLAFIDSKGTVLALSAAGPGPSVNLDESEGLSLAGLEVVRSALNQVEAGSIDALGQEKIILSAAYPVFNAPGFDPPGAPVGVGGAVVLGVVLDEDYVLQFKRGDAQEAFLITKDRILARTSPATSGVVPESRRELEDAFDEPPFLSRRDLIGGTEYFSSYVPLRRTDGVVVGAVVLSQKSEVLELTQRGLSRTLFLVALIAAAIGILLSFLTGSRITRPILRLTRAAERVRAGDLQTPVEAAGDDEVGILGLAFGQMTESLSKLTTDLRTERNQLAIVLQSMADGVVAIDRDGVIVSVNREAERILASGAGDLIGKQVKDVLILTDPEGQAIDLPFYALQSGSVFGTAAGAGLQVAVTSAPMTTESGDAEGAVAVVRDLTAQAEVERMKSEFLANISHELRTPLTPIKGYADLLRRRKVSRAQAITFLEGISASALRLERIVEMLVDFSAMESGRLIPSKEPLDLNKVTERLVTSWKSSAPKHKFQRTGFRGLRPVEADARLVTIAISELIDNAVKFSPKGGKVVVTAEVLANGSAGDEVRISVTDRGIGMKTSELDRIGESFVQADASSTRRFGGLGLGLAYVRRIAEGHGGRLEVSSDEGKGSKFTLILPAGPAKSFRGSGTRPKSKSRRR